MTHFLGNITFERVKKRWWKISPTGIRRVIWHREHTPEKADQVEAIVDRYLARKNKTIAHLCAEGSLWDLLDEARAKDWLKINMLVYKEVHKLQAEILPSMMTQSRGGDGSLEVWKILQKKKYDWDVPDNFTMAMSRLRSAIPPRNAQAVQNVLEEPEYEEEISNVADNFLNVVNHATEGEEIEIEADEYFYAAEDILPRTNLPKQVSFTLPNGDVNNGTRMNYLELNNNREEEFELATDDAEEMEVVEEQIEEQRQETRLEYARRIYRDPFELCSVIFADAPASEQAQYLLLLKSFAEQAANDFFLTHPLNVIENIQRLQNNALHPLVNFIQRLIQRNAE